MSDTTDRNFDSSSWVVPARIVPGECERLKHRITLLREAIKRCGPYTHPGDIMNVLWEAVAKDDELAGGEMED